MFVVVSFRKNGFNFEFLIERFVFAVLPLNRWHLHMHLEIEYVCKRCKHILKLFDFGYVIQVDRSKYKLNCLK